MFRYFSLAVLLFAFANPANAQVPLRLKWQTGQVQTYAVEHTTTISETIPLQKNAKPTTTVTTTKLNITRKWTVKAVADDVATLEMSISAIRQEVTKPIIGTDGKPAMDTLVLDSATPEGAKQVAEFLNKPILTASVNAFGSVANIKATTGEQAVARLQAELPFRALLPQNAPAANATWDRTFAIKLDPPIGTGESFDAKQTYTFKGIIGDRATIGVATALVAAPKDPSELQPLLPWLWEGEVFIDAKAGRYLGAKLSAKKELANHAGNGTKFVFASEYIETALENE